MPDETTVAALAEVLHDAYEIAASDEGWETQERSRVSFTDLPDENRRTMLRAVGALLASPALADLLAKAEQRGREDNADHNMCYVHGSVALEALLRAERVRALREAADALREAAPLGKLETRRQMLDRHRHAAWLRDRAEREAGR